MRGEIERREMRVDIESLLRWFFAEKSYWESLGVEREW